MTGRVILIFSGQIGSGKSSLAKAISDEFGFPRISFGGYVRHLVVQSGGDEGDRKALQDEGERQVRRDPKAFLLATLDHHDVDNAASFVIEGLRHVSILNEMRKLFGADLFHIHLAADKHIAFERAVARGDDSNVVACALQHSVEADVAIALLETADVVLPASESQSELIAQVIPVVEQRF
ncbi:AAA family ATPase [Roseovarius sp. PS-C2]|uniref:AAA family ATPase n=1 Tax=Roseovarius sp. PS-C2 TaxID=2820814 RepID=UPI001C0B5403|nr:AAA family ATPase [Roseovarius sp. PS-C2]MBU3261857.1 AAA family ATPase [Roseovarius sp. PS-C2]